MIRSSSPNPTASRLDSLDILRGLDLFLLVFLQPVIISLAAVWHPQWFAPVLYQLDHEVWVGFRCWDLVMPLFLFMTGAAMPFSFSKFRSDPTMPRWPLYRKILRRFLVLFLLGMIVQGNLLGFDPDHIFLYNNTLQAIAAGYLISALLLINFKLRNQIIATILLLIVYSLPMSLTGDFSPEGNFAYKIDELILGRFRGDLSYTWIWSSLTFAVTVMLGVFAGQIIRSYREKPCSAALYLLAIGVALILSGYVWSFHTPIIKRLWTGSMTLLSGGFCFVLMAAFFYWIDVKGHHCGLDWLKIYGMNSITAYILGETINFRSVAASLSYGLQPYLGAYYDAWLTFANFLIIFLILLFLFRHRIFLKI